MSPSILATIGFSDRTRDATGPATPRSQARRLDPRIRRSCRANVGTRGDRARPGNAFVQRPATSVMLSAKRAYRFCPARIACAWTVSIQISQRPDADCCSARKRYGRRPANSVVRRCQTPPSTLAIRRRGQPMESSISGKERG